jgi:hypothetical protein
MPVGILFRMTDKHPVEDLQPDAWTAAKVDALSDPPLSAEERAALPGWGRQAMNMPLGYTLLRDRRVPIRCKLIALGVGAAAIGVIEVLQLPIDGIMAALLPFIGAAGDLALDGAEAVIGSVLIATLLLPQLLPRLKAIHAQKLYRAEAGQPEAYPN